MEKYKIEQDIKLLYVQAASFPLGVGGAFKKLDELTGHNKSRLLYGISNEKDVRCLVPLG